MRYLLVALFFLSSLFVYPQTAKTIIDQLITINKTITDTTCKNSSSIISNRAMNIFLAYEMGYAFEKTDLSFYTNYVSLNTAEGNFSVSHNFQKSKPNDEQIKKLFNLGISSNILKGFVPIFLDKMLQNEIILTFNYKWLGKVKTTVTSCLNEKNGINQKQAMNVLRASILQVLIAEIKKKEIDFENAIATVDSVEVPGQNIDAAKVTMRKYFYEKLQEEYALKFSILQAEILSDKQYFKQISTSYTSMSINVPVIYPKYYVASSISTKFQQKHSYPLEITLSHTRFWESVRNGKLFLTIGGNVLFSNSVSSYALTKTNLTNYKNSGGSDTSFLATLQNNKAYIGNYKNFITPLISMRLNYFPPSSHIGLSILAEQSMGSYSILNTRIGLPIVLINNKQIPAINFEFYVLFYDMNNKLHWQNNTSVGVGMGIPLSRLMY